jgi:hypothetical protein
MGVALIVSLVPWGLPMIPVHAAARSVPRVTFTIPASNVAFSDPVLDDRHVVYGVATPHFHRPVCVSCGNQPFTNFHVEVYVRGYQSRSISISVSQPRLLFIGPRGTQIGFYSLSAGWLVYATYGLQDRGSSTLATSSAGASSSWILRRWRDCPAASSTPIVTARQLCGKAGRGFVDGRRQ